MNVLAIGCHPDDLESCCGGTLIKYVKQGHKVFMGSIANGNVGHRIIQPDELRKIRLAEAKEAAKIIGAEHFCIDQDDLYVESSDKELFKKVVEVIRWTKPDVIITHNPVDYMRDHEETSKMVVNAAFCATVNHLKTESPEYTKMVPVFYMDTVSGVDFSPTEYVDISEEIEQKLEASNAHQSQLKWLKEHDDMDFIDFIRTCSKYRGQQCSVTYAEGFRHYSGWQRFATKRLLP